MSEAVALGAIDAGSNALRIKISRYESGELQKVASKRVAVRLGRGAFTRGELDDETIDAAVQAFVTFREMFDTHGVDLYRAVATSALRNAHNRDVLLHRLHHEAGIELEVIPGHEEARLARKAVTAVFKSKTTPRVILDLGGGSFEVNIRRGKTWKAASIPIVTVRLVETFALTGAIDSDADAMIRRAVDSLLDTAFTRRAKKLEPAVACGGNAEALAKLFGSKKSGYSELASADLDAALPELSAADVEGRMDRYGVRRDRAEVMGVAAIVYAAAARHLGLEQMTVPGVGIRDALLVDLAETLDDASVPAQTARGHAIVTAARQFTSRVGHDTTHSEYIRSLARLMFNELASLHGLPPEAGHLLEAAAILHDVGVVVDGRSHHKHGEYMVLFGRIRDLTPRERQIIASLVRTHRKSTPDETRHRTYAGLDKKDRRLVRKLCAILRLADGLDYDHRQHLRDVKVSADGNQVSIHGTLHGAPTKNPGQADYPHHFRDELKQHLFEQVFGAAVAYDFAIGT